MAETRDIDQAYWLKRINQSKGATQQERLVAIVLGAAAAGGEAQWNALSEPERARLLRGVGITNSRILQYAPAQKAGTGWLEGALIKVGQYAPAVAGAAVGGPVGGAVGGFGTGGATTGNLQGALKGAAIGAAAGQAVQSLRGTQLGAGGAGAGPKIKGNLPGLDSTPSGGGLGNLFGTGISAGDVLKGGLAVGGLIQSSAQQGKANEIIDEILARERAMESQRAPLRESFVKRIGSLPSQREDLGSLFASENPFANRAPTTSPAGGTPGPGTLGPLNPETPEITPQPGTPAATGLQIADQAGSPSLRRLLQGVMRGNRLLRRGA